jgi:hypothetical protein
MNAKTGFISQFHFAGSHFKTAAKKRRSLNVPE